MSKKTKKEETTELQVKAGKIAKAAGWLAALVTLAYSIYYFFFTDNEEDTEEDFEGKED